MSIFHPFVYPNRKAQEEVTPVEEKLMSIIDIGVDNPQPAQDDELAFVAPANVNCASPSGSQVMVTANFDRSSNVMAEAEQVSFDGERGR